MRFASVLMTLSLVACLGAGDDDDDDDDGNSADAPLFLDGGSDGGLVDAFTFPDGMTFVDGPSGDIAAACTAACNIVMECFGGTFDECFGGCETSLAACTAAEIEAVAACGTVGCDTLNTCLTQIPCLGG